MSCPSDVKVIIFDLDGVLADTRQIHFLAWKKTFDNYFKDENIQRQFTQDDYNLHVDGKPRAKGISDLFSSLGLPTGDELLQKLGDAKNQNFLQLLSKADHISFPDVFPTLRRLRSHNIKMAVVSSSENCRTILEQLKVTEFIDEVVDGRDGKNLQLRGKPESDYYREVMNRLKVNASDCILIEDAISGIIAGKKAGLSATYGLSRPDQTSPRLLLEAGADHVFTDLLTIENIPDAIQNWDEILFKTGNKDVALFLDFDGTLSNIVSHPDDARLISGIREVLLSCAHSIKVAIISGRDRSDVKNRVGVENIFYGGCHGLELSGPGCFHYEFEEAYSFLSSLEKASLEVGTLLFGIKGILVERKRFATAIHYRGVSDNDEAMVREKVQKLVKSHSRLRLREGKKVLEILPDIKWGKGESILKLIDVLAINLQETLPIYIGDDTTDEEAFYVLKERCLCLRVGDNEKTHAHFSLKSPAQVKEFLGLIQKEFVGTQKRWRYGT